MNTVNLSTYRKKEHFDMASTPEIVFFSQLDGEIYKASKLKRLETAKLEELRSEVCRVLASLDAQVDEINIKIAAGTDDYDIDWTRKVRGKRFVMKRFYELLIRETRRRTKAYKLECKVSELLRTIRTLQREVIEANERAAGILAHEQHDKDLRSYEYEKRKAFYAFVQDKIGRELFDQLMDKAAAVAGRIAPNPATKRPA